MSLCKSSRALTQRTARHGQSSGSYIAELAALLAVCECGALHAAHFAGLLQQHLTRDALRGWHQGSALCPEAAQQAHAGDPDDLSHVAWYLDRQRFDYRSGAAGVTAHHMHVLPHPFAQMHVTLPGQL
jgi:hypothetical protein